MKLHDSLPPLLIAFVLSSCVDTVELDPVYEQDKYPAFSDGSFSIEGTNPWSAPNVYRSTDLSPNAQARTRIQNAVNRVTYKPAPEDVADAFQTLSNASFDRPNLELTQEQKDDLLLNNLSKYRKYAKLQEQKLELEQALDEIAAAYGKTKYDRDLFSSIEYFRTYVSYLALCREMRSVLHDE